MTEFNFQSEQALASPIERVFAFFGDAGNLEAITPPWLKFRILTPRPIPMRAGAIIDYSLRLHGIPFGWRTEITAWEPPVEGRARFQDEQRKGPYRYWIHEHTFAALPGEGGATVVRDRVRYAVPGGAIPHALFVRPRLERIFAYRAAATKRLIEGM